VEKAQNLLNRTAKSLGGFSILFVVSVEA